MVLDKDGKYIADGKEEADWIKEKKKALIHQIQLGTQQKFIHYTKV